MSAAELIEQIKALPPAELEIVRNFLLDGAGETECSQETKYLDRESARRLGEKVMDENSDLFRRLAQ